MKWKREKMWNRLWKDFMKSSQYTRISEWVVDRSIRECFYQAFFLYDYCEEWAVIMKEITPRVTERVCPCPPGESRTVTYFREAGGAIVIHFGIYDDKGRPIIARVKVE